MTASPIPPQLPGWHRAIHEHLIQRLQQEFAQYPVRLVPKRSNAGNRSWLYLCKPDSPLYFSSCEVAADRLILDLFQDYLDQYQLLPLPLAQPDCLDLAYDLLAADLRRRFPRTPPARI